MRTIIKQHWYISTIINDIIVDFPYAKQYGTYLSLVKDLSPRTIANYMGSLERFWIWSLAVKPNEDEDFPLYLSKYRRELKNGLTIYNYFIDENRTKNKISLLELNPKVQTSVDQEISCLKVFFDWHSEKYPEVNLNKEGINWLRELHRRKNSKHSSYISNNINSLSLERIAKKESLIAKPQKRIMNTDKAFPFEHFLELVNISKPREKLIYLLMGGTSARISQVLNLTIYDIDFHKREIYLSDPTVDDVNQKGYLGITRRRWLKTNYQIDAISQHPHNKLGFKYPIPSNPNKPLYWINQSIKDLFFKILADYNTFPEHLRNPKHPFFFTKVNGERLLYKPTYNKFKKDWLELSKIYTNLHADDFSPHALRHMWGNYMAEIYYLASLKMLPAEAERIRLYTQEGMGHSDFKATDTYFKAKMTDVIRSGEEFYVHYLRDMKHLPPKLFLQGLVT